MQQENLSVPSVTSCEKAPPLPCPGRRFPASVVTGRFPFLFFRMRTPVKDLTDSGAGLKRSGFRWPAWALNEPDETGAMAAVQNETGPGGNLNG